MRSLRYEMNFVTVTAEKKIFVQQTLLKKLHEGWR